MTYPLKSNIKKKKPIATQVESDWLNWIANFFNDTTWTGLTFTPTQDGLGCTVETTGGTVGYSGFVVAGVDGVYQRLMTYVDGVLTDNEDFDIMPTFGSSGTVSNIPVYGGGFTFYILYFQPHTTGGSITIKVQGGATLYSSGIIYYPSTLNNASFIIPTGTSEIEIIAVGVRGAVVNLQAYYKI